MNFEQALLRRCFFVPLKFGNTFPFFPLSMPFSNHVLKFEQSKFNDHSSQLNSNETNEVLLVLSYGRTTETLPAGFIFTDSHMILATSHWRLPVSNKKCIKYFSSSDCRFCKTSTISESLARSLSLIGFVTVFTVSLVI